MRATNALQNPITEQASFTEVITKISSNLTDAMSRVLVDLPNAPHRAQQLSKQLELNKDLTSRLIRALKLQDPIAAIHIMPGPIPLRRVLDSAQSAGVSKRLVRQAILAVDEFDTLIRSDFGSRADLDAAVSYAHPPARERHETTAKQAVFRGTAGLRGISVDTMLVTFLLHPSAENSARCDTAVINAYFGLRRTRPGAHFEFTTFKEQRTSTRNGLKADRRAYSDSNTLMNQFCSSPELPLKVEHEGEKQRYVMIGNGIGLNSSIDIVTHEFYPQNHPLSRVLGDSNRRWFFATADQPAMLMIFDVLVHRDIWPGSDPSLVIYDTATKGIAKPDDPARDCDRLNLVESILPMGHRPTQFRTLDAPRYLEMLETVSDSHNWNLEHFRGYRTRITYPFYGSQTCMIFDPFTAAPLPADK